MAGFDVTTMIDVHIDAYSPHIRRKQVDEVMEAPSVGRFLSFLILLLGTS